MNSFSVASWGRISAYLLGRHNSTHNNPQLATGRIRQNQLGSCFCFLISWTSSSLSLVSSKNWLMASSRQRRIHNSVGALMQTGEYFYPISTFMETFPSGDSYPKEMKGIETPEMMVTIIWRTQRQLAPRAGPLPCKEKHCRHVRLTPTHSLAVSLSGTVSCFLWEHVVGSCSKALQ